jgi:hypothetical protein
MLLRGCYVDHVMSLLDFCLPRPYLLTLQQQVLQVYWLSKLFRGETTNGQLNYMPYYVLGNVMIGTWQFFW